MTLTPVGSPGLVGRSVDVELDGVVAMTVITGTSGLFSFELPADSSIARGEHQIAVKFQGEAISTCDSQLLSIGEGKYRRPSDMVRR